MTFEEAEQLAELLKVPLDEVLRHAGLKLPTHRAYPITGWLDENGLHQELDEAIPVAGPDTLPPDAQAVQVRAPGLPCDGWLLFVDPDRLKPGPSLRGRLGLVKVRSGPVVLSYITRGYRPDSLSLDSGLPLGPRQQVKDAPVEWAAPILLIQPA